MKHATAPGDVTAACTSVVAGFFEALDLRNHESAVALFTPDGIWERNGTHLKGRTAIAQALAERPAGRTTFHLVANPLVSLQDASHAEVRFFLVAYEANKGLVEPIAPSAIRRCVDRLEFDGERWRIAHKSSQPHMPPASV
ncbi:nuclear transport factor 2 family protein [Paraburkholderia sp. J63]|uniref:nuclear transport factor 2 family protein n=1 Tax=Paraburkholderia sp. J63 TaxID=2805434 RepID=UPI002ABE6386|nr:nuclear transport factor 2 family protein [Paraburkholderia sp. J63]